MQGTARRLMSEAARPRPASYQHELREAYRAFLKGSATGDQQQAILVDLFKFVGYYATTTPEGTTSNGLWFSEGQRSVGARILSLGNPASEEIALLAQAVRAEMLAIEEMNEHG